MMKLLLPLLMLGATTAHAEILVKDAYAVAANPAAKSGGVFMLIENTGDADVTLLHAQSDVAKRVEIHTTSMGDDGVMSMHPLENGLTIPAMGCAVLARGGNHVMLMGLSHGLSQGDDVPLTLTFDNGDEMPVTVNVDTERGGDYQPERDGGLDECVSVMVSMDPMGDDEMGGDKMGDGAMPSTDANN